MGYYSDVKICLHKENFEELKKRLGKIEDGVYLLNNMILGKEYEDTIIFGWESIKWYEDSFYEIKIVSDFLNELYTKGIAYKCIIIGEDIEDVEIENFLGENNDDFSCDKIYLTRYIGED